MPTEKQSSFVHIVEQAMKSTQVYQEAISVINRNNLLDISVPESFANQASKLGQAVSQGLLDASLTQSVTEMLGQYNELVGAQAAVKALGDSFSILVKPEVYDSLACQILEESNTQIDVAGIAAALQQIPLNTGPIDTSWIQANNRWLVEKELLSNFDIPSISGISGAFAMLCRLEQQTSKLAELSNSLICASAQIASISKAIIPDYADMGYPGLTRLLSDYCNFATKQHVRIQKATEKSEIEWRLAVMDAASKYVDRQFTWSHALEEKLSDERLLSFKVSAENGDSQQSEVALLPKYIGFTRRRDIQKTPEEGFEKSSLVTITEKGKRVAEGILNINKLRLDQGNERIFGMSETVAGSMLNLGTVVCTNGEQLGKVIDGLYAIFYENLEHIKKLVGSDKKKGDQIVREESVYQCIFNVKTIRSDLRHDLDHGGEKERAKKLKAVGDCYRLYCNHRPLKARDYRALQEKLYDEFILLEEELLLLLINK